MRTVGPLVSASILFQMLYAALLAFTTLYLVDARGMSAACRRGGVRRPAPGRPRRRAAVPATSPTGSVGGR